MWKNFDLDSNATFIELVEPVMPVDEPPPNRNKLLEIWNAYITRNYKYDNIYFKRFQVFEENKKKWDRYHKANAKLRECVELTIALQKKAMLRTIYLVHQWLIALRNSTVLVVENLRLISKLEYKKLMGNTYLD